MNVEEVEIDDITKLANFIIDTKSPLAIESQDFKNNRDLFFFCIELTTKMLSIKYGNNNGQFNIEDLNLDQIKFIKNKLIKSCIQFNLNIEYSEYNNGEIADIIYVIPDNDIKNNIDLDKYIMIIKKKNKQYNINFELIYYN
tara:strand:- start:305 stop:730 length:426 start_codon:yes stop_codon:yes gene_type:complete